MKSTLSEVLLSALDRARADVHVSVVVRVVSYNAAARTATVVPLVLEEMLEDGERVAVDNIEIPDCPVQWPCGGESGITFGLDEGAECLAIYRHRSHDEIDEDTATGPVLPALAHEMSPADLVILPLYTRPGVGADPSTYAANGQPVIYFPGDQTCQIGDATASKALALAESVASQLNAIRSLFDGHTHVVTSFSSPSAVPVPIFATSVLPSDVACDDVKVRS